MSTTANQKTTTAYQNTKVYHENWVAWTWQDGGVDRVSTENFIFQIFDIFENSKGIFENMKF